MAMNNAEIIVCVADDLGLRVWLERSLENTWPIEFVAASDLTRVIRLVEATGSHLVFVATDDGQPEQSLRVVSALVKSHPELNVVTLARRVTQDQLLKTMRAGARDCFLSDSDGEELRNQVKVLLSQDRAANDQQLPRSRRKGPVVNLLTGVSAIVDTRFAAQSLAYAAAQRRPGERILAIDTAASDRHVFYQDSSNRLTLDDLLNSSDTLDESLVNTALDEVVPGMRILGARLPSEKLTDDWNADLFIAFSQLLGMFDYIVVNVAPTVADHWVRVVGLQATRLVMVIHPIVEQAHLAKEALQRWQPELAGDCERFLLVDGFEDKIPPGLGQLEAAVGIRAIGTLPLDWPNRLLAKNAGIPIHQLPRRTAYGKALENLLRRADERLSVENGHPQRTRRLLKRA